MKYYFLVAPSALRQVIGYTMTEQAVNCIEIENPSQDLLENFIFYKLVEGELVKMPDEEFRGLYPNYGVVVPTENEITNQRITDQELNNLETNQRITDLELFILEGGN